MYTPFIAKLQLGKQGITPNFVQTATSALKNRRQIRISVLASTGRTRESMNELAEKLISQLPISCRYKVVGFTIIIIKTSVNPEK
jgi:RNA-binding protein YhbY